MAKRGDSVGIKELKDRASAIVEHVQKSRQSIIVTKNNRDVVRIVPISAHPEKDKISQKIEDLGLLAVPARISFENLTLETIQLEAGVAVKTIRQDRDDD